jgi:endoglucanase
MDFFDKITTLYKDNENLLFEIMNEPSGETTWQDCKDYANQVIPVIRKNNDGVILVGNPQWSSDLDSVMKDPLVGYENIMYTYHFYAADHYDTTRVIRAYAAGIPVFITEHGGMESSGDGAVNFDSIKNWYSVLNNRNISYIAWNISNTKGSASILKYNNTTLTEFNVDNMKTWGVYYRARVRERFGLPTGY